jgi:hypothetical protein
MTSNRRSEPDDLSMFRRYAQTWRYPQAPTLITDPFRRDPHEVLEELRETNADEHALLTEYLVLPEKPGAE